MCAELLNVACALCVIELNEVRMGERSCRERQDSSDAIIKRNSELVWALILPCGCV